MREKGLGEWGEQGGQDYSGFDPSAFTREAILNHFVPFRGIRMASKLEIEKYCNRYEELYSCVHALEAGTLADDEIQKLDAQCRDLCVHLNKINSPNTDCKPLQ